MHNSEVGKASFGGGKKWILLLFIIPMIALVFLACGKDSNEPYTGGEDFIKRGWKGWTVGWNTSWGDSASQIPISRDGRYAYFRTRKSISTEGGASGKKWRSPYYRGRVDLVTGEIDTTIIPEGMSDLGFSGLLISDTVSASLTTDSVFGTSDGKTTRQKHGYGDGRFVIYIRSPNHSPDAIISYLIDNYTDTYRVVGTRFRFGWIATDEKAVLLVDESEDSWVYDIATGSLTKIDSKFETPEIIRDLRGLSVEKNRLAREAMTKYTARRIYRKYPKGEEF